MSYRRFLLPEAVSRIARLELRAAHIVEGYLSGIHRSPFFGQSVEFVQHRQYVPGDDIRHIDWKVWGKADRWVVKQYEEDTNLRATLLVDVSESMHYGSGALSKYEYACTATAAIAYLLLRQQDAVSLVAFDERIRQRTPSRSKRNHLAAMLAVLDAQSPAAKTDLYGILRSIVESEPRRGMIVLVSDLLAPREPLFRGLKLLRSRGHDVLVLHVMDDDELEFRFTGTTRFEGLEEMPQLTCDPKALRAGYVEAVNRFLDEVRRGASRNRADYMLVRTSDALDAVLARFLHRRVAMHHSLRK